jgi:transcriptional regulator with XRE-family HTH domain
MTRQYTQIVFVRNYTKGGLSQHSEIAQKVGMSDLDHQHLEIGQRLTAVRVAFSNLSQKDWAKKHLFSQSQYSNWENGIRRIPVESAEKLCDLYGLTLDFVYRGRRDGLSESASKLL